MKQGIEYTNSKEKKMFDKSFSRMLRPIALTALKAFTPMYAEFSGEDSNPIFAQWRVGANGQLIWVEKFRTLKSGVEDKESLNKHTQKMRKYGIDELPQYLNILNGKMTANGGIRAHTPKDWEIIRTSGNVPTRVINSYDKYAVQLPPSMFTPFAAKYHNVEEANLIHTEEMIEAAIKYAREGSLADDIAVTAKVGIAAISGFRNFNTEADISERPELASIYQLPSPYQLIPTDQALRDIL